MKEVRTIDDMIEYLQSVKKEYGNIEVCYSEEHEYWASLQSYFAINYNLRVGHAQPHGPKSGKIITAVVFGN